MAGLGPAIHDLTVRPTRPANGRAPGEVVGGRRKAGHDTRGYTGGYTVPISRNRKYRDVLSIIATAIRINTITYAT